MSTRPLHVGIDLGTTNSAVAVYDGQQVTMVRNSQGATLTPSVVRLDARGNATVGARARRFLDTDPDNTRAEFKRLMGADHALPFAALKATRRPEELAALVLGALRQDVAEQVGVLPERAVISVPALFELPQIGATSEAARLAGFERIEVIQEPVASAIAAGWSATEETASWLVYDLGGGTFDASLLHSEEGLLRVVGHDGDNFLGGRDFDGALVQHILDELAAQSGARIQRSDPAHAKGLRRLRLAVEEAKIELGRAREAAVVVPDAFVVDGQDIQIDAFLDRATVDRLVTPLVDRSIAVCRRLLAAHGMTPADLGRIVLVGGPTAMPVLRSRVSEVLGVPFGEGLDPMTLVAQGAALYAATAGVDGRPAPPAPPVTGQRVWLQYPAVTGDPSPYLVGRLLEKGAVEAVKVRRADGGWESAAELVDAEGAFAIPLSLQPRKTSEFHVVGAGRDGRPIVLQPSTFQVVHGVTVTDPPLSRSIGVALANNSVHPYFERGSPLPMRRTFRHKTVETVAAGADELALRVPIVQGEFPMAHLCRLVGTVEIRGKDLTATLPMGSDVELTVELDRGGRLSARALIPALGKVFEEVAQLAAPRLPPEALEQMFDALDHRAAALRARAFRERDPRAVEALSEVERLLGGAGAEIEGARGGDGDAQEKARRLLLEADAALAGQEAEQAWPELEAETRRTVAWAASWVAAFGSETERKVLAESAQRVEQALTARAAGEVQRQLAAIDRLGSACYFRSPGGWSTQFDYASSRVSEATDLRAAEAAVREGRAAQDRDDRAGIEKATRALWRLLPPDPDDRKRGHDSGVQ